MRKKRWEKWAIAASLIVGVGILSACSGGGGQPGNASAPATPAKDSSNGGGEKQQKVTIKIAHVLAEDTSPHLKFVKFKEILEQKSNGRLQVEIYPNSQLGGEREITESTQMGNIQIASPSIGQLSNFSKALMVFDLPFIFKDTKIAYEVLDGPVGQELLKGLEANGLLGLGFSENGWRHLTSAKGPITSPDQIQGMKLRTMEVPLHMAFWKELGANPTPMAFTEVFTALSQGVVDGQENPFELINSMKFYEPNPYITTTGHIYDPEVFLVNKSFFESLSPEDQQLIRDAAKESIQYQREMNTNLDSKLRKELEEKGVTVTDLTEEQKQVWIEKVKPVYETYADEVGRDTLKKVLEAAGNTIALESLKK